MRANIETPCLRIKQVTIDCKDPKALSAFYVKLLGWEVEFEADFFVRIIPKGGVTGLGFQKNEDYVPPVWPEEKDKQQQMEHVDFYVENEKLMEAAVQHALSCGATKAAFQSEGWTVLLDPEGHPFCIDLL